LLLDQTSCGDTHSFFCGGMDVVGHFGSRVTFRFFDAAPETIIQAPPFLPLVYYKRAFGIMDSYNGPFTGEYTSTMFGFINNYSKPDWKYDEPGDTLTSNEAGGYSILFEKGSETTNNRILKEWILENSTFNALVGLINFDTIFYVDYYKDFVFCKHLFLTTPSGNIIAQTIVTVLKLLKGKDINYHF